MHALNLDVKINIYCQCNTNLPRDAVPPAVLVSSDSCSAPPFPCAAPHYSSTGEIIYSGADLKTGGVMEYYKDGIFVCIFCQMLGAYTNWAWLALLAIPAYAFYMLWVNVVGPWWNSSSNVEVPESELDRKKREKRERQAARAQKFAGKR